MSKLAPIALFCYNRLACLQKVLAALAANTLASQSTLYIFSDGPKDQQEDAVKVKKVRQFIHSINGFAEIHIREAQTNQMLAPSLIQGIGQVLEQHDRIIVIEDDVLVNRYFLEYINEALDLYQHQERVGMIHGHVVKAKGLPKLFFNRQSGSWGWGTWRRAWNNISFDGPALLAQIQAQGRNKEFDQDGEYPFTQMLKHQIQGRNSSWAIRCYASFFLQGILTLYPSKAMSVHIGYNSGTHFVGNQGWTPTNGKLSHRKAKVALIPIQENIKAVQKVRQVLKLSEMPKKSTTEITTQNMRNIWTRSKNTLKRKWQKIKHINTIHTSSPKNACDTTHRNFDR